MAGNPGMSQSLPDYKDEEREYYHFSRSPDHELKEPVHNLDSDVPSLEHEESARDSQRGLPGVRHDESIQYWQRGTHGLGYQGYTHNSHITFGHEQPQEFVHELQSGRTGLELQQDLIHGSSNGKDGLELTEPTRSQFSAANYSGYWKASLDPVEGQEGLTPYLDEQLFEKAEVVLDEDNNGVDTELIFNSIKEAYRWRSRTRVVNPQSSADPTIPRRPEQIKAAVKLVFKAYKSVALATDNAGMLKAFREQKHDNRHVETICWTIVEGCIDRCDRGPLLNAFEPEKAKNTANIKNFADRLDAIVESLSQQKTICKHLLDAPYLNRFLDDPVGSRQRVESNRKLNKRKGGVMDVGKKALGMRGKRGRPAGTKGVDGVSDDEAEECGSEYKGDSSDLSSQFRTPDQPIVRQDTLSGPPRIGRSPVRSTSQYRSETPTPPSRLRGRAIPYTALPPMRTGTPQSPYSEPFGEQLDMQYGNVAGANQIYRRGNHSVSTSMLPGSMMDPTMPPYGISFSPNMVQSRLPLDPFADFSVGLPISLKRHQTDHDKQNSYTTSVDRSFYDNYTASAAIATTSAPFQPDSNDPSSPPEIGENRPVKSGGSSNDSIGSDEEYFPTSGRKRRRPQH